MRSFIVEVDTPGFAARPIERKSSLRASVPSELVLMECRVPAEAMPPGSTGLCRPLSGRSEARHGIVWDVVRAAGSGAHGVAGGRARHCYPSDPRTAISGS